MICTSLQYCSGNQKKKKEKGKRVALMVTGEVNTGFWWGELRERDYLEDLDIDRTIILQGRQCTYERNIEVCLPNNCYRGQAIIITYSVCVFVALLFQNTKRMFHIILSSVICPAVQDFSTLSHKRHNVCGKVIDHKIMF
jgi:hypothetical protein